MPANHRKRGLCSFEGCGLPHRALGLCKGHYTQQIRGYELKPIGRTTYPPECTFEGCSEPTRTRGWCEGHYGQSRRGTPMHPLGSHASDEECTFEGCNRPQACKGLCAAHDAQKRRRGVLRPIGYRKARGRAPKAPRVQRMPPPPKAAPVLPKGWGRTTTPAPPKRVAGMVTAAELPPVPPTPRDVLAGARACLELFGATDLAEMLGLTREAA